ncbi:MAG TPA: hypothetical protein DHL02_06515, partial [Achromobacter sp.]|nr:hypothetical protein [Achromobacter sp.]
MHAFQFPRFRLIVRHELRLMAKERLLWIAGGLFL